MNSADALHPARPPEDEVAALRAIVEGTARHTGREFFQTLVQHLARAVGVRYALIAEFAGEMRSRTLAYWFRDAIIANIEWDLTGTPCELVVRGNLCHYPHGVKERFPLDRPTVEWGIESYLGVPLCDVGGEPLGHLAVFDERPMSADPLRLLTFRIFAARAAAELERIRAEQMLADSERRFRDLYEEAPTAYVTMDTSGRVTSVNKRATVMLGYAAGELTGNTLSGHATDKPTGKERLRLAHQSALTGPGLENVEIELRRRDGGPLWVVGWFKPLRDRQGNLAGTRSIWADITDRVLAEQEKARLQQQNLYLQEELKATHNSEEIVGKSPALARILANVQRVAPTDSPVLLAGETGTGKELIARAIHAASRRRDRPLIKINCAAWSAGLVESELFGHEKGAFTGAMARRIGRFELAHGGTLFLDEIGALPLDTQAKLLRVLQERAFQRVGGTTVLGADVRVLAATSRDLSKAVQEQQFREDLYWRLSVFPLHLPPLRERRGDIPLLVHFLVGKFAMRIGRTITGVEPDTMDRLTSYSWPGNVRELENVLERAVVLTRDPVLEIDPNILPVDDTTPVAPEEASTLQNVEHSQIMAVLAQTNWVIEGPRGAAHILGIHPNTLRNRMKKLGIVRGHEPS